MYTLRQCEKTLHFGLDFFFILWTVSLQVLEACVKNCGQRFHILVSSQEFIEGVLVRSILPKYNPPTALHDRVLSLIQVCRCFYKGKDDINCLHKSCNWWLFPILIIYWHLFVVSIKWQYNEKNTKPFFIFSEIVGVNRRGKSYYVIVRKTYIFWD